MAENNDIRDRTYLAILDGASKAFMEKGDLASMADVAHAAGVGRATLYRYFQTREELVTRLHQVAFDELAIELDNLSLSLLSLEEALARFGRSVLGVSLRHSCVLHDFGSEQARELARAVVSPKLIKLIEDRQRRGEIDPNLSSNVVAGYFGGMLATSSKMHALGILGIEEAASQSARIFARGVSVKN